LRLVPSLRTQALSSFLVVLKADYCGGEETEGVFDLWLQDRLFLCVLFLSFFLRFLRNRRNL
jgi:hypothetical protein